MLWLWGSEQFSQFKCTGFKTHHRLLRFPLYDLHWELMEVPKCTESDPNNNNNNNNDLNKCVLNSSKPWQHVSSAREHCAYYNNHPQEKNTTHFLKLQQTSEPFLSALLIFFSCWNTTISTFVKSKWQFSNLQNIATLNFI